MNEGEHSAKILAFLEMYGLTLTDLAEMKSNAQKDGFKPMAFVFPAQCSEIFGVPIYFDEVPAVRLEMEKG